MCLRRLNHTFVLYCNCVKMKHFSKNNSWGYRGIRQLMMKQNNQLIMRWPWPRSADFQFTAQHAALPAQLFKKSLYRKWGMSIEKMSAHVVILEERTNMEIKIIEVTWLFNQFKLHVIRFLMWYNIPLLQTRWS